MSDNMVGQTIAGYEFKRRIGSGRLGVVYEALDTDQLQTVAIKVIHPALAKQETFRQKFNQLAGELVKLRHPNIITIHKVVDKNEALLLVMDYMASGNLGDYLRSLPKATRYMEPAAAQTFAEQIAKGLHYAHQKKIIHGSIKPSNILLKPGATRGSYEPMLADFGLAKLLVLDSTGDIPLDNLPYMSPEHFTNPDRVNAQSDIYSAGIIAYEVVAGRPPFDADNHYNAQQQHSKEAPPKLTRAGISLELKIAIETCLAKDANDRFHDAGELALRLRPTKPDVEPPQPRPAEPPPPPPPDVTPAEDSIKVTVSSPKVVAVVQQPASVNLTITNQSRVVDHFTVEVSGIPAGWYTLEGDDLKLLTNEKGTRSINFNVPRSSASTAAQYDVQVTVSAKAQDLPPKTIRFILILQPFYEFDLDLNPALVQDQKTSLTISNKSNTAVTFNLSASGSTNDLSFELAPQLTLNAGAVQPVPIVVKPKQRPLVGTQQQKPFEIKVTPTTAERPLPPKNGLLVVNPRLPRWVVTLVPIALIVGAALAFMTYTNIQNTNATATAIAQATTNKAAADAAATETAAAVQTVAAHQTATADWNKADPDNDRLSNQRELELGTDPDDADSDDDGLSDGDEVLRHRTNPLNDDSDNDGMSDGEEIDQSLNPNNRDSDGDGIPDGRDNCPDEGNLGNGVDSRGCPRPETEQGGSNQPDTQPGNNNSSPGLTPQQAFERYWYSVINDQDYGYGWGHQTARFQRANSLTFDGFVTWASGWQSVTISNVNIICEANNLAVVRSLLIFTPAGGGTRVTINGNHQLQRDSVSGEWFFNSSDPGNNGCDRPVP